MTLFSTCSSSDQPADITSAFLDSLIDATLAQPSENSTNHDSHVERRELHAHTCADLEQRTLSRNRVDQLIRARNHSPAGGREAAELDSLVQRRRSPTKVKTESQRLLESKTKRFFYQEGWSLSSRHAATLAEAGDKPLKYAVNEQARPDYGSVRHGLISVKQMDRQSGDYVVDPETGEIKTKRSVGRAAPIMRLHHREYCDEYRIRVDGQTSLMDPPPPQEGERVTKQLTGRAATKILDSGAFVNIKRGGFTTFLTLTFDNAARWRLDNEHFKRGAERKAGAKHGAYTPIDTNVYGQSTIGREVSRFFDAAQRMYQRGWQAKNAVLRTKNWSEFGPIKGYQSIGGDMKVPPSGPEVLSVQVRHTAVGPEKMECLGDTQKLDYIWVAEAPKSGDFEVKHSEVGPVKSARVNPHCHVLMRWEVEPWQFYDWAYRLERLWGNGFANLQRIENSDAASGYLLKALGYMMKGGASDQGEIRGNRYNISKSARAPAWELLAEFEAQNMIACINECKEKWERQDAPIKAKIKLANIELAEYRKIYMLNKFKKGVEPAKRKITLDKIKARMDEREQIKKEGWEQLKQRPARAHEYQLVLKNRVALAEFLEWASGARLWNAELVTGAMRDWEHLRTTMGEMVRVNRAYYRSMAEKVEDSEILNKLAAEDPPPDYEDDGLTMAEWAEYQLQGEAA